MSSSDTINNLMESSIKEERFPKLHFAGWNLANFCENTSRGGVDQFMPIFGSLLSGSATEIGVMNGVYSLIT